MDAILKQLLWWALAVLCFLAGLDLAAVTTAIQHVPFALIDLAGMTVLLLTFALGIVCLIPCLVRRKVVESYVQLGPPRWKYAGAMRRNGIKPLSRFMW